MNIEVLPQSSRQVYMWLAYDGSDTPVAILHSFTPDQPLAKHPAAACFYIRYVSLVNCADLWKLDVWIKLSTADKLERPFKNEVCSER